MINTDIFIEKGKSHQMCQDYAISGTDPFPYVIISDGCSSSKDTDVGARILALAAKNFLTYPKDYFINYFKSETSDGLAPKRLYNKMGLCIINKAFSIATLMSLGIECLDATLIISFIIEDSGYTYVYGDGNILSINGDDVEYININFPSSAPFYLSYYLNPSRMVGYFESFEDRKIIEDITNIRLNDVPIIGDKLCKTPIVYSFGLKERSIYLVGSDGLDSFISVNNVVQNTKDLVPDMVKFKNFNGQFIARRFKRFLTNLKKGGINHFDDISVGGFYIGEQL